MPLQIVNGEAARGAEAIAFDEITPMMRSSVEKGLRFIAEAQAEDGSYGSERMRKHVGMTALAAMAFMADGHVPGRGKYGSHVDKAVTFVLSSATESGFIAADTSHGPMYGHGFATLMLGEAYGMTGDPHVREVLIKAVRLIVNTQNHEGGWRYHPIPFDADISVTICQIMALRSARNAGLSVPKETIDRAIAYVRQCQNPADGGFRYMLSAGGSAFPRSAAGVASLFYAGVYEGEDIEKGLGYLVREGEHMSFRSGGHYYYGHYYAGQAMYLAGGDYWKQWYPKVRDELITRQNEDGSWESSHGKSYGTSMSLLIMQIPNRLLPIFQR
ncbi:prenyltransferase/squalene oxidase repeat-containing protein [Poriferisphaera sp. WC338]|uniref:prenyltransferase/squalene oxidase repeat-containing protein n=1 Tax=Poriferisphaera sp. WC338 TaxID=3425129 RepID=UPI003D816282